MIIYWYVIPNLLVTFALMLMVWHDGERLRDFDKTQTGIFLVVTLAWPIGALLIACQAYDKIRGRR